MQQQCRYGPYCRRWDCAFEHDRGKVPCVFYLQGNCLKGDSCPFLHQHQDAAVCSDGPDLSGPTNVSVPPSIPSPPHAKHSTFQPQDADFPVLGNHPGLATQSSLNGSYASVIGSVSLQRKFPWVDSATVKQTLKNFCGDSELAANDLERRFPKPAGSSLSTPPEPGRLRADGQRGKPLVSWIPDTGDSVSELYTSLREKAAEQARLRNVCFQKATTKYKAGKKAEATALGRKGREHQKIMEDYHSQAAAQIFEHRNKGQARRDVIDLHGLHPQEVELFLRKRIEDIMTGGKEKILYVVTGNGHHSHGLTSKLAKAVTEYLDSWGFHYEDVSPDGRGGTFSVRCSP